MAAVQQGKLKNIVTISALSPLSKRIVIGPARAEKILNRATYLIPIAIRRISNIQDNIPILSVA
ncbi:hypothetical protein ASC90_26090 [Rhizobium sp. Root1220]|nr:hypothetical protein ASC90_26090 [Rhizobium sp. Root1220]